MRVRNSGDAAARTGVTPIRDSESAAARSAAQSAKPAGAAVDAVTIAGIPEAELTPKVRAAIDRLISEVQSVREELVRSRTRIEYLEELADQDPLAPVINRRAFVRELARMIAYAERYNVPGSVLYLDIDGMKGINDSQGHAAGDAVLKHVAEVLLDNIRASDIVGRLGGDEFGVILAQADPRAAAAKAAALAAAVTSDLVQWHGERLEIAVSYGAYTFAGGEEVEEALSAADEAMYAQKRAANLSAKEG